MIVYFHGYASSGVSAKTQALKINFGASEVLTPSLPVNPNLVENIIDNIAKGNQGKLLFIGTSLGGFWANYAAQKYNASCVIINPACNPSDSLSKFEAVTDEMLAGYVHRECWLLKNTKPELINLFLAANDEVLNYNQALEHFANARSIIVTPDGGHRYNERWSGVVEFIEGLYDRIN